MYRFTDIIIGLYMLQYHNYKEYRCCTQKFVGTSGRPLITGPADLANIIQEHAHKILSLYNVRVNVI